MTRVLVIDDEPLACDVVEEYLEEFSNFEILGRCHDGFDAMKKINELQPELIFLDVQMPKITGFELLELLEEPPAVIFTTAFDQYAIKAFEANAVDYLLKPFAQERFEQAVQKFLDQPEKHKQQTRQVVEEAPQHHRNDRLVIKDGSRIRILPFDQVLRVEADDDYVTIISDQGKFVKKKTLSHYEKSLPQDEFIRVHRSHLINISRIDRIHPYGKNTHVAKLQNGEQIPVSRSGYQKLKDAFGME